MFDLYESRPKEDALQRRVLAPSETIHMIPPLSELSLLDEGCTKNFVHTLVPGQIEGTAKKLGLSHKVYGGCWWPEGNFESEEAWEEARDALIAEAEAEYEWQDDVPSVGFWVNEQTGMEVSFDEESDEEDDDDEMNDEMEAELMDTSA